VGTKEPRLFTRAEAERTLPLVRRVTHDLMVEFPAWRRAVTRYELLVAGLKADDEEPSGAAELRAELEQHARRMDGYLAELDQVGCVFKGFEEGLVDFYSLRDDKLVFLCWRYGEERITHWHDTDAGYGGRQPVDDDMLSQVT
jgi:hypothetical protein